MHDSTPKKYDDEISILDVVSKVWQRRGMAFGGIIFGVCLGLAWSFFSANRLDTFVEYFVEMPTVSSGKYPNGAEFSPQDLLVPEVLARLSEQVGGISPAKLRNAINVELNSPIALGIVAKYRNRLKTNGLSSAEIDKINESFQRELRAATASTVRIVINHSAANINVKAAEHLLLSLPQVWSDVQTTQFRVFDDPRLPISLAIESSDISTTIGLVNADRTLENIQRGLYIIANDNRLVSLQSPSGATAFDLVRRVENLINLYLGPLLSFQYNEDGPALLYVQHYKRQEGELIAQLENIRGTIDDIRSIMIKRSSSSAPNKSSGDNIQIDSGVLETIFSLHDKATLAKYLTDLFVKQEQLVEKKANLRRRILRMTTGGNISLDNESYQKVEGQIQSIIFDYNQLLARARELLRTENALLYRPIGTPVHVSNLPLRKSILITLGSALLGFVLSLSLVFLAPYRTASV